MDKRLCQEVGIDSLSHSSLFRRWAEMNTNILMEIFTSLGQKVSTQRPSSKTSSLQLIDSTTIPLNKTWFSWAKFRQTKSGIKLHLNLCYLDQMFCLYKLSVYLNRFHLEEEKKFGLIRNLLLVHSKIFLF